MVYLSRKKSPAKDVGRAFFGFSYNYTYMPYVKHPDFGMIYATYTWSKGFIPYIESLSAASAHEINHAQKIHRISQPHDH